MNEKLKQLALQAGGVWSEEWGCFMSGTLNLTRFAELVRQDEREACAQICDVIRENNGGDKQFGARLCADEIRWINRRG
jgi:hypothetical protein